MVTVKSFEKRKNADGEEFCVLFLEGGLTFQQSQKTGQFYALARKTSITTTLDEKSCKNLLGTQLPGSIKQVKCEPFEVINKETGEIKQFDNRWSFTPELETHEEAVFTEDIFDLSKV